MRLLLEINIKMSSVWFKIPASINCRGKTISIWEHWIQLVAAAVHPCDEYELWGIHKLGNTVSLLPRHHKPRTLSSLWCAIAVYGASELELKVICVINNSTIFFVMEKNKRYSYDAGYKFKVQ